MPFLDDDFDLNYEAEPDYVRYQVASSGERLAAGAIDFIICLLLLGLPLLNIILPIGYLLLRDALPFLKGQSLGKKLLKLRVLDEASGQPITGKYDKAVLRSLPHLIPLFNILDVALLFSSESKRYGDKWANTTIVVKEQ